MQIRVFCNGGERLRGGGGHKGACTVWTHTHTHTQMPTHASDVLFFRVCEGVSGVWHFVGLVENAATTQLDWQGNGCHGGEEEIKMFQNRNFLSFPFPGVPRCSQMLPSKIGQLKCVTEQWWRKERKSKQIRTFIPAQYHPQCGWMGPRWASFCCEKSPSE